jgi:hypothetical protein
MAADDHLTDADWEEVQPAPKKVEVSSSVLEIPNPLEDPQYKNTITQLRKWHKELLELEQEGKLFDIRENPTLVNDYQVKIRLYTNMLYAFMNNYLDALTDLQRLVAEKRQLLYEERLTAPKGSPSAADQHAKNMTRIDEMNVVQVKNRIDQIKNEYERFNGICISLQSRSKADNSERIMG